MATNFNMNFDPVVKQQFAEVLADYGLTVPQAFKLFANQVIKTQSVPLSFDWRTNKSHKLALGAETIKSLEQGSADY